MAGICDPNDRWLGCVLGGAVGDALGAPVEFASLASIRHQAGADRLTTWQPGAGSVTDDTQMTLFTLEGLIRASVAARLGQPIDPVQAIYRAYLRWLTTQDGAVAGSRDGWLVRERVLHHQRAPGVTCLSALRSGRMGTTRDRLNNSKGCGGVMRAAPCGLMADDAQHAFDLGCASAAITHSHPSGWYSAGALAAAVCAIQQGRRLSDAVRAARDLLDGRSGAEETAQALDGAVGLAADRGGRLSPEDLEQLGGGWVGEEALAIAVACALAASGSGSCDLPPAEGIGLAASHSGDSDSTAAIAGNLLGAAYGMSVLPESWLRTIDVRQIAEQLVNDARIEWVAAQTHGTVTDAWRRRYPPS